jgi:hypothetical protein
MKYKVGQKVLIKNLDWYNLNKDEDGDVPCNCNILFLAKNKKYLGTTQTVETVYICEGQYVGNYIYKLKGIENTDWTDDMIEGVEEETPKFKPNDIVDTNDNLYGCVTDDIIFDETKNTFKYYVSFIVDGGYYYEYQLKPHIKSDKDGKIDAGEVSDGYHTFNELYDYRALYNAAFFNSLAVYVENMGYWDVDYDVHKSKKHSDGEECFGGGWFVVMAELPTGQISNHYPMKDWDLFHIPEKEKANKWDGHTPQDVAKRMREFLAPKPKYPKTYEECLKVLSIEGGRLMFNNSGITQYERELYVKMNNLSKLLICRDAYWKLYGEEMGLGKSWEPDWLDDDVIKYVISYRGRFTSRGGLNFRNYILAFPTEEMQDYFYTNFKQLIEQCKELL